MPSIRHDLTFPAPPARVYAALTDPQQHGAFTGAPAEGGPVPGGAFSAYGGRVVGRHLELVPNERIVQAWRSADWPAGTWTLLRFELSAVAEGTRLAFVQDAIPEASVAHLDQGWHDRYWKPLHAWLTASA